MHMPDVIQTCLSVSTLAESTWATACSSSLLRMPGHSVAACPTVCPAVGKGGSGLLLMIRSSAREWRSVSGTWGGGVVVGGWVGVDGRFGGGEAAQNRAAEAVPVRVVSLMSRVTLP